jgi:AraC-like DNA-binding protein
MPSSGASHADPPRRSPFVVDTATGDRRADLILFQSDTLKVIDRLQTGPKNDWGVTRGGGTPSILFLRAGLFECRTSRENVLTDTTYVKCYDGAHEYHLRRLLDEGEAYTLICPGQALMEEAFSGAGYQVACPGDMHLRHLNLHRDLLSGELDSLDAQEAVLCLLADVAKAFGARRGIAPANSRLRARLQEAQAYVAADPARDHRLQDVASIAGVSEFHFARLFRAETGQSLRSYRKRLRLRLALKLISEGEGNLSRVALDSGFSTHSHMSAAFQAEMGRTPSAARALIAPLRAA